MSTDQNITNIKKDLAFYKAKRLACERELARLRRLLKENGIDYTDARKYKGCLCGKPSGNSETAE